MAERRNGGKHGTLEQRRRRLGSAARNASYLAMSPGVAAATLQRARGRRRAETRSCLQTRHLAHILQRDRLERPQALALEPLKSNLGRHRFRQGEHPSRRCCRGAAARRAIPGAREEPVSSAAGATAPAPARRSRRRRHLQENSEGAGARGQGQALRPKTPTERPAAVNKSQAARTPPEATKQAPPPAPPPAGAARARSPTAGSPSLTGSATRPAGPKLPRLPHEAKSGSRGGLGPPGSCGAWGGARPSRRSTAPA